MDSWLINDQDHNFMMIEIVWQMADLTCCKIRDANRPFGGGWNSEYEVIGILL